MLLKRFHNKHIHSFSEYKRLLMESHTFYIAISIKIKSRFEQHKTYNCVLENPLNDRCKHFNNNERTRGLTAVLKQNLALVKWFYQ